MAEMHDTTEEYLEAILSIEEEGVVPMRARLVERLGLSAAAVSETVGRLSEHGFVDLADDRSLHLTDKGRRLATTIVRRHRLAERFLVEVVGLPWYLSHEEATVWGRAISSAVEERFVAMLDDPATCVHGNPIPGTRRPVDQRDLRPLPALPEGASGRLERLTEDLELDLDVMRFLQESGLMPGAGLTVASVGPDGTRTLEVDGDRVALGPEIADNLWVRTS